jgi:carbon-monoxide dehydrogenase medium subunit
VRFDYVAPQTLDEAISELSRYRDSAKVLAGGTDLINLIRTKVIRPRCVVDIGNIPGLGALEYDDKGTLSIGTLVTIRSLEMSASVKAAHAVIAQAASQIGSMAVRNVGTLGGNLCHASPAADTAPCLMALGAMVRIVGPAGERSVAVEEFFTGPGQTVLHEGEILVRVQVPAMTPQSQAVYLKQAIRGAADLAIVGVAVTVGLEEGCFRSVKIALGAVAPTPIRAKTAEKTLAGQMLDDAVIAEAAEAAAAECRPVTDVRASADYRREMVKVFTRRALRQATQGLGHDDRLIPAEW